MRLGGKKKLDGATRARLLVCEIVGCTLAELPGRISGWEFEQWVRLLRERYQVADDRIRYETPQEIESFFRSWAGVSDGR